MITISGAYGREYDNIQDVKDDWLAGKDFYIVNGANGAYMNRSDWKKYASEHTIRWSHLIVESSVEDYFDKKAEMGRKLTEWGFGQD